MPQAPSPVGAGGRLSAAFAAAQERAAQRLAPQLERVNTATYLAAMQTHARALGASPPRRITDPLVRAGLKARALDSARSIAQTRAERMRSLVAQEGSVADAKPAFTRWERQQGDLIARHEAGRAAMQASNDFVARNGLTGVESVQPADTDSDDQCADDIAMGEQPIGTFDDYPIHPRCIHHLERSYDVPAATDDLWVGDD